MLTQTLNIKYQKRLLVKENGGHKDIKEVQQISECKNTKTAIDKVENIKNGKENMSS